MSTQPQVLRNVIVSEHRHALVRPGSQSLPSRDDAMLPITAAPVALESVAPAQPAVDLQALQDEAFRRGREQGRQEGLCEAFDAARAEALTSAREQGLREGREAAQRAAQDEARASVKSVLDALERLLTALPQRFDMRLAAHEEDMLALSFEAVTRILGKEAASEDGVRYMLKQTLAAFGPRRLIEIRVHPGDVTCLMGDAVVSAWLREREAGEGIQIVADPAIELGGIVLRSPSGRLDARLEHQVDALRTALLTVRAARANAAASSAARPARPSAAGGAAA
jgi:flagellar assembly protein FliH